MRLLFLVLACSFFALGDYRIAYSQGADVHRDRPSQRWLRPPDGAQGNVLDQLRVLEQLRSQMAAGSDRSAMPELTETQLRVLDEAYKAWTEQSGGAQLPDWDNIPKEWIDQALANPQQLRDAQRLIQQYARQRNIPSPPSLPSLPKDWKIPWLSGAKGSKANDSAQRDSDAKRSSSPSGEVEGAESQASPQQASAPRDAASSKRAGSRLREANSAARRKPAQPDGDVPQSEMPGSDAADSDASEGDPFQSDRTGAEDVASGKSSLGSADAQGKAKARAAAGKTGSAGSSSSSTRPSRTDQADDVGAPRPGDATGSFQSGSSRRAPGASSAKSSPNPTDAAQLKALRELLEKAVQAAGPSAGADRRSAPARRPEPNRQANARGAAAQPMPRAPGAPHPYPSQAMTPLPFPQGPASPPYDPGSDPAAGPDELAGDGDRPGSTGPGADVSADSGLYYAPSTFDPQAAASNSSARAGSAQQAAGQAANSLSSSLGSTNFGAGNLDLRQLGAQASAKSLEDNSQAALQAKIQRDVQQLGWNGALHRIIQETFQEELKASQAHPTAAKPNQTASSTKTHETKRSASRTLNIDTSAVRKHIPNLFSDGRVASALAEVWKAIANAPLSHSDSIATALPAGPSARHHSHKSKSGSHLGLGGNEVRIALVMVAAVAVAVWIGRKRPAWLGAEQPIDPRWAKEALAQGIRTRADVIRAFHRLVAHAAQPVASWWTHRYAAQRLAEATPQLATAMADLSSVYEQARYMPPEAELSAEQISRVCGALRQCASYGNSQSAADATS